MSKPPPITTEKMLEHQEYLAKVASCTYPKPCPFCDAIRAIILAVEGWKKLAGKHENLVNLKAVRRFLCDIRDFGEEKK